MGARGELFTTQVILDNRSYFFNVKENRTGDVFLQIVESKNKNGEAFDRHQIAVFAEDMQKYLKGFEAALSFIKRKKNQNLQCKRKQQKKSYTAQKRVLLPLKTARLKLKEPDGYISYQSGLQKKKINSSA